MTLSQPIHFLSFNLCQDQPKRNYMHQSKEEQLRSYCFIYILCLPRALTERKYCENAIQHFSSTNSLNFDFLCSNFHLWFHRIDKNVLNVSDLQFWCNAQVDLVSLFMYKTFEPFVIEWRDLLEHPFKQAKRHSEYNF